MQGFTGSGRLTYACFMSNEELPPLDPEHPERDCLIRLPKLLDGLVDSGRLADQALRTRVEEIRSYVRSAKDAADRQQRSQRSDAADFGAKVYARKAVQAWNNLVERIQS